jgi:hypothetical protein
VINNRTACDTLVTNNMTASESQVTRTKTSKVIISNRRFLSWSKV